MKLARFRAAGRESIGLVVGDGLIDLNLANAEFPLSMLGIAAGGAAALDRLATLQSASGPHIPLTEVELLAPISRPGKYLAIGMNYRKHVEEAQRLGVEAPKRQFWFNKQTTCVNDPYGNIAKPAFSDRVDYEVELGVMIGAPAHRVSAAQAQSHIFGFFIANDVSVRDWQMHSPTFTMGKSFDTHGPIGPWIVTADEIADCHALDLRCSVNGEVRQSSNTSQMIFNVYEQIEYLSTAFTLETGDLLATGTPEGVGAAMEPPSFLQVGDIVRCEIDGIGVIENRVIEEKP